MIKTHHTLLCIAATFALLTGGALASSYVYVPNKKSGTIQIIDTATRTVVINLKLTEKNPERAIFNSDSRWLYVSAQKDDVVDTKTLKQVTSIKIGSLPRGLGCLPDASRAYVAGEEAKTVYSIDASIQSVLRTI